MVMHGTGLTTRENEQNDNKVHREDIIGRCKQTMHLCLLLCPWRGKRPKKKKRKIAWENLVIEEPVKKTWPTKEYASLFFPYLTCTGTANKKRIHSLWLDLSLYN